MSDKEISEYIFVEDYDLKGDLAIVFGTWNLWRESTEKAADLYKRGLVPKVIVSGGVNPESGINEGDLMSHDIEKLGVPIKDILVENKATNTLENVIFSRDIIDGSIGLRNIQTIIAVVKNYHSRRALMTLKKHMPDHIKFKAATYISPLYDFSKGNWFKSKFGKETVMGEVDKIHAYLEKGDLAEL